MSGKTVVGLVWWLAVWPAGVAYCAAPASSRPVSTQPTTAASETQPPGAGSGAGGTSDLGRQFELGCPDDLAGRLPYQILAYAVVILALGGVGLLVAKKVLPKIVSRAGKSVSILETVHLGPKKTLHLLQVGTQRFLVAGSRDQVSLLGEVTSAFREEDAPAAAPAGGAGFASVLGGQPGSDPDVDKL